MSTINKVFLVGNVGRDPEIRYMPNGNPVVTVSIATNAGHRDQNGDWVEKSDWHYITAYDKVAEYIADRCKVGTSLHVDGRLKYEKFTDQSGNDRHVTKIIAQHAKVMARGVSEDDAPRNNNSQRSPAPQRERQQPPAPAPQGSGFEDMDDDIPF